MTAVLLLIMAGFIFTAPDAYAGATEFAPVPGKAVVIVYREKKLKASAVDYKSYLNDVPLALISNGTWAKKVVRPGTYDLWIEMYNPRGLISRAVTTFKWDAGRVYFIKEDSYFISDGLTWRSTATLTNEQTAKKEIKELKQVGN